MSKGLYLGEFEHLVMLAILRLNSSAYGMALRRELETRAGREVSIGAIYATLERLEAKGLVSSRDEALEAGGRVKRIYAVTSEGSRALSQTHGAIASMMQGLTFPVVKAKAGRA